MEAESGAEEAKQRMRKKMRQMMGKRWCKRMRKMRSKRMSCRWCNVKRKRMSILALLKRAEPAGKKT